MKQLLLLATFLVVGLCGAQQKKITVHYENQYDVSPIIDSTTIISEYKNASQFLGLINTKLYAFPRNPNYDYGLSGVTIKYKTKVKVKNDYGKYNPGDFVVARGADYKDKIEGKEFTVKGIKFEKHGKEISASDWNREYGYSTLLFGVNIFLKDDEQNEFILEDGFDFFINNIFYEYLKRKYVGNEILYDRYNDFKIKPDFNEVFEPKYSDKNILKVNDLIMQQSSSSYSSKPDLLFLVTDNMGSRKIPIYNNTFSKNKSYTLKKDYDNYIKNYNQNIVDNHKKYLEKTEKEMEVYRKEKKAEDEVKYNKLIKKYSKSVTDKILNNEVWIGMTKDQLIESKGKPKDINTTQTKNSYSSQYVYESRLYGTQYIYLENGKVTAIQSY